MSHGYPCEHPLCGFPKAFANVKVPDESCIDISGNTKAHPDRNAGAKFAVRVHYTPMDTYRQKERDTVTNRPPKRGQDIPVDFVYPWGEDNEAAAEYFWEFLQSRSSWSDYYTSRRIPDTFNRTRPGTNDDGGSELSSSLEGKRCKTTGGMGTDSSDEKLLPME